MSKTFLKEMQVICPYCGAKFLTSIPNNHDLPFEIECVPYTRDIGRFDPKNKSEWLNKEGWSRIGKDYLPYLNWEWIGILRTRFPKTNVQYRVQGCLECHHLFDVYANYTEKPLNQLWPHLFGSRSDKSNEIIPYIGKSWIIWLIDYFGKYFKSDSAGAILIGLIIFLVGLVPWFIPGHLPFESNYSSQFIATIILYGLSSVGITIILILYNRFVNYLVNTCDFYELLKVQKKRSVVHWRNYTLCRFVGVQSSTSLPKISQIDVVAGGLSIITLLVIWSIKQFGLMTFLLGILGLITIISVLWGINLLLKTLGKIKIASFVNSLLIGSLFLIISIFIMYSVLFKTLSWWQLLQSSLDLIFWVFIVYILGTAAWLAMNPTLYILKGLTRIPMNLIPYDYFKLSKPLYTIQIYSSSIMVVLFIIIITIVSIVGAFHQPLTYSETWINVNEFDWVISWMRWALAILFVAIGIAINRTNFIWITLFYIVFASLFSSFNVNISIISINGNILILGTFLTIILLYQVLINDGIVKSILFKVKTKNLDELESQIGFIKTELDKIKIVHDPLNRKENNQLLIRNSDLIANLLNLIRLRDFIKNIQIKSLPIKFRAQLVGPFVMSLIFPTIWNKFFGDVILDRLIKSIL